MATNSTTSLLEFSKVELYGDPCIEADSVVGDGLTLLVHSYEKCAGIKLPAPQSISVGKERSCNIHGVSP